jgi:hypothetical protein
VEINMKRHTVELEAQPRFVAPTWAGSVAPASRAAVSDHGYGCDAVRVRKATFGTTTFAVTTDLGGHVVDAVKGAFPGTSAWRPPS